MNCTLVVVYANDENIGDFLSAQGIALVTGGHPRLFPFERRIPALGSFLKSLDERSTVIVGGGGLLKVSFDRFWRVVLACRAQAGFRLILWGVGYCDVVGEDTRGALELARQVVQQSAGSAFRDRLSYEPFSDLPRTRTIGCPALHAVQRMELPVASKGDQPRLLRVDHPGLLAGISNRQQLDAAKHVAAVCEEWARPRGMHVDTTSNMVRRVGRMPDRIRARMAVTTLETRLAAHRVAAAVSQYYAPADIVVTSRLHGAIIAAALGKPIVALSNDAKIDQFMSSIGLSDYVTDDPREISRLLDGLDCQPATGDRVEELRAQNEAFAQDLGFAEGGAS